MPDPDAPNRLFHHARREAVVVGLVWLAALVWTVGYCYLRGYDHDPASWVVRAGLAVPRTDADFRTVFGLPDWVAYGIVAPWAVCTLFTLVFGLVGMPDDDLGAEAGESGHGV
jgi:hypothetical protein